MEVTTKEPMKKYEKLTLYFKTDDEAQMQAYKALREKLPQKKASKIVTEVLLKYFFGDNKTSEVTQFIKLQEDLSEKLEQATRQMTDEMKKSFIEALSNIKVSSTEPSEEKDKEEKSEKEKLEEAQLDNIFAVFGDTTYEDNEEEQ